MMRVQKVTKKLPTYYEDGKTPLDKAIYKGRTEITDFLRKHGGKTKKELEAAGN